MAAEPRTEAAIPAPTEQIHLPPPSYQPVLVALGVTISLAGIILSWYVFALGMVFFVIPLAGWIRGAREELAELPLGE